MVDKQSSPLGLAFTSQLEEAVLDNLTVTGEIPTWLAGSFIANGPAQFELGDFSFNHWFDGFAMLKQFKFNQGKVSFQNKFLRSNQYVHSTKDNKLYTNEFSTYASPTFLGRLIHAVKALGKEIPYDNCNVNTTCINNRYVAMTESNHIVEFNKENLSTIGEFQFDDSIKGQLSLAHPHLDPVTGDMINITIEIDKTNIYHIYRTLPNSTKRELILSYQSNTLFYIHSFSITPNYIILFHSPLTLNKYKLLFDTPFNHALSWKKYQTSKFIVIHRQDKKIFEIDANEAFLCLHSVNAYEKNNEIILDLVCYQHDNVYQELTLMNLRSAHPALQAGETKRYVLNVDKKQCRIHSLSRKDNEFPMINYHLVNGHDYRFVYSIAKSHEGVYFLNEIQKLNVQTGHTLVWTKDNYYPGEPCFIPRPDGRDEDDGVLLSLALDVQRQHSCLIILNAKDLQPLAEIALPFHLPFGLHGQFFKIS